MRKNHTERTLRLLTLGEAVRRKSLSEVISASQTLKASWGGGEGSESSEELQDEKRNSLWKSVNLISLMSLFGRFLFR